MKGSCLDILAYFVEKENLVKNSCLEILLKSLVFHSFAKSRETLVFGDFLNDLWSFAAM